MNDSLGNTGKYLAIIKSQQEEIDTLRLELKLARRDDLTKLPKRQELLEAINEAFVYGQLPLSLIFMDLNGFKAVNDTAGHEAGDMLLVQFATFLVMQKNLLAECGQLVTVARLHGDEFVILLPYFSHDETEAFVAKIRNRLNEEKFVLNNEFVSLRSAMGVASTSIHGCLAAKRLLHIADMAMYEDKKRMKKIGEITGGFKTI